MPIVSSTLVKDGAQKDGRQWVTETHTDHVGVKQILSYLAAAGLDANAVMVARVAGLETQLTASEIAANIAQILIVGSLATPTFVYSTQLENFAALRTAYLTSTQYQATMIGDFLSARTSGQLQTAFGMTAGQVTTLRTNKLTPAAALATSIRAALGQ